MKDVRVAVLGYGEWGANLANAVAKISRSELCAIVEASADRRKKAEQVFPEIKTFSSAEAVLKDPSVEAVLIATPASTHFDIAREMLAAGKHTFVEKPIAMTSADARVLEELSRKTKKVLMPGHIFLFHPAVEHLAGLVQQSQLGKVIYALSERRNWGRVRNDVNAWWNLAPHDVSILLHLFGMPSSIAAYGRRVLPHAHWDSVNATLTWDSGLVAGIDVSWIDPGKTRKLSLVGTKMSCVFDDTSKNGFKVFPKGSDSFFPKGAATLTSANPSLDLPDSAAVVEPMIKELTHFINCIRSGATALGGGERMMQVTRVLEAGQEALDTGGTIYLDKLPSVRKAG